MTAKLLFLAFCVAIANGDYVMRKLCKNVDSLVCRVHGVEVDPCSQGPFFCLINNYKSYGVTLDVTPQFASEKLKLAIYGDPTNNGTFGSMIQNPINACDLISCPLRPEERITVPFYLKMNNVQSGKFPVKIVMWDKENENLACCATFTVKVK